MYEYRHLVGDVSAVCSVYATSYNSWYPLLLVVLMLVFDGGITITLNQFSVFRTETAVYFLFAVDGT